MGNLTPFITLIAAVSLAAERIVEILKGWFPKAWLFASNADPVQESRRCAWIHVLAGVCGALVAVCSDLDIWQKLGSFQIAGQKPHWYYWAGSWAFTGLLASGGSAVWNHSLDILKATKVKQEQTAKAITADNIAQSNRADAAQLNGASAVQATPAADTIPDPRAVNI